MSNLKMDFLHLAGLYKYFVETSTKQMGISPSYCYSAPGYTWKNGLQLTDIKLDFMKDNDLLLLLGNCICGGISSCMGPRYIESDEKTWRFFMMRIIYMNGRWFNILILAIWKISHLKNYTDGYNQKKLVEDCRWCLKTVNILENPPIKKLTFLPKSNKSRSQFFLRLNE